MVKAACLLGKSEIVISNPTLAFNFQRNKMFLPHLFVKIYIVGSIRDREVACSASDRQGSNFESSVCMEGSVIYFTILRRFSRPSLAYMCTKVA